MDFINEYVDYASELTASPKKFHRMMAYSMLSQVIGRRPTYHHSGPIVGPNLWTLVLAPSSTMAKSSALGIGSRILSHAYNMEHDHILSTGSSSENLFERLEENPNGIFLINEFVSMINWFKSSYATDVQALLIQSYDQPPFIYKSIGTNHKNNKKKYKILSPFINAYAVSSYDLFNSVITQTHLLGGFLARWILVREDSSDNYRSRTTPPDIIREQMFGENLREILRLDSISKQFDYDAKALKLYDDWFNDYLKGVARNATNPFIQSYCQRRVTDLHKFSMIHCLLRGGSPTMNTSDTDEAICIIQQSIVDAIFLLENKINMSREEEAWNKIIDYIRKFQEVHKLGAPHQKILHSSKIDAFQFKRYIDTLSESGRIIVSQGEKTAKFYRLP